MSEKTIFEKIIDREIPAHIVYEDDAVIAILDIQPVNPGHTLVIPKKHFKNMLETPDDVLSHVMSVAKKIANALTKSLEASGVNIIINNGEAAGQVVFHTHVHVIPRYKDDGHEHWQHASYESDQEQERIRSQIQKGL